VFWRDVVPFEVITQDEEGNEFNAESFLRLFTKSNDAWWSGDIHAEQSCWLFRGHSNASWSAVPRVFRDLDKCGIGELVQYFRQRLSGQVKDAKHLGDNLIEYALRTHSYSQAFYDFMAASKKIGLLPRVELFHEFPTDRRNSGFSNDQDFICFSEEIGSINPLIRDLQEGFELAQHYGLPTHLLDWTSNPLVSLHFATSGFSKVSEITDISIHALEVPRASMNTAQEFVAMDSDDQIKFAVFPASFGGNTYAQKQSSYFTVFNKTDAKLYWTKHGLYPDIEDVCRNNAQDGFPRLKKFIVTSRYVAKIRNYLDRMDISDYSLLPSFSSVVSSITRTWSVRGSLQGSG
jgi:hypothetical protein